MDLEPPGANYVKPFYLFHYNQPKLPPLKQPKRIKLEKNPAIPVKSNNATKLRDKTIKEYLGRDKNPHVNYLTLSQDTLNRISAEPDYVPPDTKTSQYRYKLIRDIPVVSCQFTEHLMMYRKPPFTFEKGAPGICGRYRLRTMKLVEPVQHEEEEIDKEFLPGILQ